MCVNWGRDGGDGGGKINAVQMMIVREALLTSFPQNMPVSTRVEMVAVVQLLLVREALAMRLPQNVPVSTLVEGVAVLQLLVVCEPLAMYFQRASTSRF